MVEVASQHTMFTAAHEPRGKFGTGVSSDVPQTLMISTWAPESLSLSEAPLPLPAPARPTKFPRDAEPSSPDRRHGATGGYLAAPSGSGARSRGGSSRGSSRGVELYQTASRSGLGGSVSRPGWCCSAIRNHPQLSGDLAFYSSVGSTVE